MFNEGSFPKYTQQQIDEFNNQKNSKYCLVILFDVVYNLYKFAAQHPGGERLIMQAAGEILDEVVEDGNHRFTKPQVQSLLAKYKFGFFEKNAVLLDSPSEILGVGLP